MPHHKFREHCQFWVLWLACIVVAAGFAIYFKEPLFSFAIIMVGVALTLIFFARSKDDDDKDIRTNVELVKLYARLANLIFVLVGVLMLIYIIGQFILKPFFG